MKKWTLAFENRLHINYNYSCLFTSTATSNWWNANNPVYQFHSIKNLISLKRKKKYCGFTNSNLDYLSSWKSVSAPISHACEIIHTIRMAQWQTRHRRPFLWSTKPLKSNGDRLSNKVKVVIYHKTHFQVPKSSRSWSKGCLKVCIRILRFKIYFLRLFCGEPRQWLLGTRWFVLFFSSLKHLLCRCG
jgi:hypothetical protein